MKKISLILLVVLMLTGLMYMGCEFEIEDPYVEVIDNSLPGFTMTMDLSQCTADWDVQLVKTTQTWIMAGNIGYYPNGTWEENMYPGRNSNVNLSTGYAWDWMLNKDISIKITLSVTDGVKFYEKTDDGYVLALTYGADNIFTSSTVAAFVQSFADDVYDSATNTVDTAAMTVGTFTESATGSVSNFTCTVGIN